MTFAIQFLIDVLSLGGAYALMALGLVLVFGILRLVPRQIFRRLPL